MRPDLGHDGGGEVAQAETLPVEAVEPPNSLNNDIDFAAKSSGVQRQREGGREKGKIIMGSPLPCRKGWVVPLLAPKMKRGFLTLLWRRLKYLIW